jgi:hypothetical protein
MPAASIGHRTADLTHGIVVAERLDYLPRVFDRECKMLVAFIRMSFSNGKRPTKRSNFAIRLVSWLQDWFGPSKMEVARQKIALPFGQHGGWGLVLPAELGAALRTRQQLEHDLGLERSGEYATACHETLLAWTHCTAVSKWSKCRGSLQTSPGELRFVRGLGE